MFVHRRRGWEMPESAATPEGVYLNRRALLAGGAAILAGGVAGALPLGASRAQAASSPTGPSLDARFDGVKLDPRFALDRPLTEEKWATTYNNFYEFGSSKNIWRASELLPVRPWTVSFEGMVEKPFTMDIDALMDRMPLEERVYRHRCVETWAMAVPWSGFPLKSLVELAKPTSSAKYLVMTTFQKPDLAPGQRQFWYPWPYVEGLTMAEATNDLAFIATGLYGKSIPPQNGAPLRLVTPWKYGFKGIKSIVSFKFTDTRPKGFWEALQDSEYGFWANVNPAVPHPRWSQASERMLGTDERFDTKIYNGYGEFVAGLYTGMKGERLFA